MNTTLEQQQPKMSLSEVRALRTGDILEVYWNDAPPSHHLVVEDVRPTGDHWSVRTIGLALFTKERKRNRCSGAPDTLNTDRFKLIGRAQYEHGVGLQMVALNEGTLSGIVHGDLVRLDSTVLSTEDMARLYPDLDPKEPYKVTKVLQPAESSTGEYELSVSSLGLEPSGFVLAKHVYKVEQK